MSQTERDIARGIRREKDSRAAGGWGAGFVLVAAWGAHHFINYPVGAWTVGIVIALMIVAAAALQNAYLNG